MGEVWRASDEALGRQVAVKLLRLEWGADATARFRFESEARFAAELRHNGIAQAFDFGEQDGRAFLVMELVPGEPLDEILARDGGLPVEAVLDLVVQACRALTVAHEAGVVHRDVKPANLMVSPDGTLKITDFGIARRLAAASQTQTGMVMGTAHYISPEQASGQQISPSADVYSLGVVAYECLTGSPPFDGRTPVEIALKHVRDAPPELPSRVPAAARDLIAEMLAKAPEDRPADTGAVADRALAIRAALSTGRPIRDARGAAADRPIGVNPVTPGPHGRGASGARGPISPGSRGAAAASARHSVQAGRSSGLPGFDAHGAADNLSNGTVTGQRRAARRRPARRRSAMTYTTVAAGLLLAGALAAGLWKGLAFASSGREQRDPSRAPATRPVGGDIDEDPAAGPGTSSAHRTGSPRPTVTRRYRTDRVRPSTRGSRNASPTQKPMRNPSRAAPSAPDPTPTPTASTTTPSTPSPDPAPTQSGKLGSEDKV
ncbi:serine/threonine protein kinase [Actinomadura rubrisoli]|uniref:non-specific serine/threonine protein kinase n=2 Tax=Actinomadura rubrisoli TaxID=2530368 RepID=A0A4R5C8Y2_9ACTN|nr:serine/threonine protein kinase [Actinomadura rubrisoli]